MLPPDTELVDRLLNREERAMADFYRCYRGALLTAVLRIVRNRQSAEDVLQESMLKIWLSIASYDAEQSRLFTWAAKVCCNTAIDYVRSSRYRLTTRSTSLEDTAVHQFAAVPDFRPEHIGVREVLQALRPEHRQVMDLLYLQGYTQLESAEALQVPLGTIKTWSVRARRQLSKLPL